MRTESFEAGASVSVVARRHDVNANQVFAWRKLYRDGLLGGSGQRRRGRGPPLVTGAERPSSSNIAILPIIKSVDTRKVTTSDDERLENHRAPDKAALPGGVLNDGA